MGLFCANLHFREADQDSLVAALKRRGVANYRVLPARRGWTSLLEERASEQDEEWIGQLTGELARELDVVALAFMVHDSDIACYWLFNRGTLVDEYNSFPDYFDTDGGDEPTGPRGGRPDVLVRYCRQGIQETQLAAILAQQPTFAESVIEKLAEALGIDPGRALADFRHSEEDGPDGFGGLGGGDDDDGDGSGGFDEDDVTENGMGTGLNTATLPKGLANRLSQMFGFGPRKPSVDPQAAALIEAVVADDVESIERLLASGVAVEVEAPAPIPLGQPTAGLGQVLAGRVPTFPMTPLLAAILHKRKRAVAKLLDSGADPARAHQYYGTAVHAAAGIGDAELLQLLIDHGADVNAHNAQQQTPLGTLTASRATLDRLVEAQAIMKSMGPKMPEILGQLSNVALPKEGWDRCEAILRASGAR